MSPKCLGLRQSQSGKNVTFQSRKAAKLGAVLFIVLQAFSSSIFNVLGFSGITENKDLYIPACGCDQILVQSFGKRIKALDNHVSKLFPRKIKNFHYKNALIRRDKKTAYGREQPLSFHFNSFDLRK